MTEGLDGYRADDGVIDAGGHPPHVHTFHEFLYVPMGHIVVSAQGREFELGASAALWIPAGVLHSARFGDDAVIAVEAFEAEDFTLPYAEVTTVGVSDGQRKLLLGRLRSTRGVEGDREVFARLCATHPDSLPLPQPTSTNAAMVARELSRTPGDARTATEWAAELYTSSTSLRRAFLAETGLAFSEWRTRLRLNHSLCLLEQGQLVSAVAAQVGFVSTNGYILAFRRYFGCTPGAYVRQVLGRPAGRETPRGRERVVTAAR
ncbi:helix-turn-helix domain-containing protein [Streptomyces goshikiensis]|uniref:helix-turn-helix transcriptional regulator n=1 Tax=Streptomyces goshikiensis TaxID=1942 RepID=UPI00364EF50D